MRSRRAAVLCSIGAGEHAELLDIARPSFERYATAHGYDLELRYEVLNADRPPSWSKITLIAECLDRWNRVLWIDADCVVVDAADDIGRLVNRRRPLGIVAHRYSGQTVPNLGVVVLRRSAFAMQLMRQLWSMTEYVDHKWWENAAFLDLAGYDISAEPIHKVRRSRLDRRIRWLSNEWNSIDLDCASRPRFKHYPGMSNEDRRRRMRDDMATYLS